MIKIIPFGSGGKTNVLNVLACRAIIVPNKAFVGINIGGTGLVQVMTINHAIMPVAQVKGDLDLVKTIEKAEKLVKIIETNPTEDFLIDESLFIFQENPAISTKPANENQPSCPKCGKPVNPNWKGCASCGSPLK